MASGLDHYSICVSSTAIRIVATSSQCVQPNCCNARACVAALYQQDLRCPLVSKLPHPIVIATSVRLRCVHMFAASSYSECSHRYILVDPTMPSVLLQVGCAAPRVTKSTSHVASLTCGHGEHAMCGMPRGMPHMRPL